MKSGKAKYILLVMVIVVWSMIIARFFSLKGSDETYQHLKEVRLPLKDKEESPIAYELHLNYEDPFLKGKYESRVENEKSSALTQIKSEESETRDTVKVKLPSISYNGMLSNLSTGEKVGFLVFERKEYMMREGDSISGLQIIALSNDSIRVRCLGQMLAIKKTEK